MSSPLYSPAPGPDDLEIVSWASSMVGDDSTKLSVAHAALPVNVHGADATGQALVTNGEIGADLIRVRAGAGFAPHTHPGHHILTIIGGIGTITYDGRIYETRAGQTYLIEGQVPHAVGAITDHVIIAVGSPHKAIDAEDRMTFVPYQEVIADTGDLTCMICAKSAQAPRRLHAEGCSHCPCLDCVGES